MGLNYLKPSKEETPPEFYFQYLNYSPRERVENYANKLLSQLHKELPEGATCRAVSQLLGDYFYFTVNIFHSKVHFNSKAVVNKKSGFGEGRLWHLRKIKYLLNDLKLQVNYWKNHGRPPTSFLSIPVKYTDELMGIHLDYNIFNNFYEAIFVVDNQLDLVYANEAAARLTGVSLKRLCPGEPLGSFIAFKDGFLHDRSELLKIKESTLFEEHPVKTTKRQNGLLQIAIQKVPIAPPRPNHWIIFTSDVTLEDRLQKKYKSEESAKKSAISELTATKFKLNEYVKNLENEVERRTLQLRATYATQEAILKNIGQGILLIDKLGNCLPAHSAACEKIFCMQPPFPPFPELLLKTDKKTELFKKWIEQAFKESVPFDSLKTLGPQSYTNPNGHEIKLEYFPVRDRHKKIQALVVVASDRTREIHEQAAKKDDQAFGKMVMMITQNRAHFRIFLKEATAILNQLDISIEELKTLDTGFLDVKNRIIIEPLQKMLQVLHTLQGGAVSFSILDIERQCLSLDGEIREILDNCFSHSKLNNLETGILKLRRIFENFLISNTEIIGQTVADLQLKDKVSLEYLNSIVAEIENCTSPTDKAIVIARAFLGENISAYFKHYETVVQECAKNLGKAPVKINFSGGDIQILPDELSGLLLSLVHVFRNSVDHGLESAEKRQEVGKSEEGLVRVIFEEFMIRDQTWLRIIISDDGQGIDIKLVQNKLLEKMSPTEVSKMSENDILLQVFNCDFSTRTELGRYSGKGVGLSALKAEIDKLGGWLSLHSKRGQGTRLAITVPNRMPCFKKIKSHAS